MKRVASIMLVRTSAMLVVALGASLSAVAAEQQTTLPPLGVWRDSKGRTDMVFDLKTDRNPSAADEQSGLPITRKEPLVPFFGLSLTRPLGGSQK